MRLAECHTVTLPVHTPLTNEGVNKGNVGAGLTTLAAPVKFVAVNPLASKAVTVTGNATPWICSGMIVLQWKDATGPGCTANTLLKAVTPLLPTTRNVTPGSTELMVTLPDHTP